MTTELQLVFVVGMQKSGTSLLNRMLMQQDFITNPFLPEGAKFWGDRPPFAPIEKPCGELFQIHSGTHGHHLDVIDFRKEDQALLKQRIIDAEVSTPILMNKNPYNSVRVSWLKSMFPSAIILAVFRQPKPNIFSLLKKYQAHQGQGVAPESGWWGIKPLNWQAMRNNDKTRQSIMQWNAVNTSLLNTQNKIDCFIDYESICHSPNKIIDYIKTLCNITSESQHLPKCKNFNREYLIGSRLLSKNKELRTQTNINLEKLKEEIEIAPLTSQQCQLIDSETDYVWQQLLSIQTTF